MSRRWAGGVRADQLDTAGRRRVLATLCLTQVTGWGVLFYAFPVLQGSIAADTDWPRTWVAGAFTAGQVIAALGGVAVGRVLDRRGPRVLMTAGSGLAAGSLVLVATAGTPAGFAFAWMVAGAAMAAVLYGPAFAAITGWYDGADRLRALTVLTVAGGLASTVFAPLTAWLHTSLDWRDTYVVLAGGLALTMPAHWWGLRGPWPAATGRPHHPTAPAPRAVVTSRRFLALTAALAITALCSSAVVVNLVPLLREQGIGLRAASTVLAIGGLGQVAGRLAYAPIALRLSPVRQGVAVLGVLAATTALLGLVETMYAVVLVVLVAGSARGCLTLLRATAVTDRWGTRHYAQLTGALSLPVALAGASAAWVGAQLASWLGSYSASFLALALLNAAAIGLITLTGPVTHGPTEDDTALLSRPVAAQR
jgi:MFS family permease